MSFPKLPAAVAALIAASGACSMQDAAPLDEAVVQVGALVASCDCGAASWTYVDQGSNATYYLGSGQSLCIDAGSYAGTLSAGEGSLVCVDADASLRATPLNLGGKLLVFGLAGTIQQPLSLSLAAGASIDNFGVIELGNVNFNAPAHITNYKGAELNFRSSFALGQAGSSLVNEGIFRAMSNFDSELGTTFTNNGYGYITGQLAFAGQSDNRGLLEITTRVNVNSSALFRNTCTLVSHGPYNVNGAYENHGLAFIYADLGDIEFNVTSAGNVSQSASGQVIVSSAGSPSYQANLRLDGRLAGEGSYYVANNTVCQGGGSAIGTSPEAPIYFFDATPPNPPQFFDIQTSTVQNLVRPAPPILPTLSEARRGEIGSDCRTIFSCSDDAGPGEVDTGCSAELPACLAIDAVAVCVECTEDLDCDAGFTCQKPARRCVPGPGPQAIDDTLAAAEGTPVSIAATTLADNDHRVSPATVRLPAGVTSLVTPNGTVTLVDGTLTFTPKPSPAASDSFSYEVCGLDQHSQTCVSATVRVTINRAPALSPQTRLVAVGTPSVVFDLGPSYSDPEQHPADIDTYAVLVSQGGASALAGDDLTYTATAPNTPGSSNIQLRVCDTGTPAACGGGSVTVIVNDPPVLEPTGVLLPRGGTTIIAISDLVVSLGVVAGDDPTDGDVDGIGAISVTAGPCAVAAGGFLATAPGAPGVASCGVQICEELPVGDSAVCSTTTITIQVLGQPPTAIDDSALVAEDQSVSIPVLANDTDPDAETLVIGQVGTPAHGTATVEGTQVRYTPLPNYNGTDSFTYQACDPSGACSTAVVRVVVAPDNDPPVAVDDAGTTAFETPIVIDVLKNDSDPDGDVLSIQSVADPAHGTAVVANGKVTYTPDAGFEGLETFSYVVRDPSGATATALVRVRVSSQPNQPPEAEDDSATVPEDGRVSIPVRANDSDPDGDPLVIASVSDPAHGTAVIAGGEIVYVPDPGYEGPDSFTYQVCDPSNACATATVVITVSHVNKPPVAIDDRASTAAGVAVAIDALANDSDPDGDPLTVTSVEDPANGSARIIDGVVSYTPDPGFSGTEVFGYTIADPDGASASARITIVVAPPPNQPPDANDDTATVREDEQVEIPVLANDADPEGDPLELGELGDPSHGTVTIDGELIVYVPEPGYVGEDHFTYEACDPEGACASATVTVTVTPKNVGPVALDDRATTPFETPVRIDVLANDSDGDGDPLTIAFVAEPAHGTARVVDGEVLYTPDVGYSGEDSFTYDVRDPSGATATATVRVLVGERDNRGPDAADDIVEVAEDGSVVIPVLANDDDPDGDPLHIGEVGEAAHGTTAVENGEVIYTPDPDYFGPDTFTYTACDEDGLCAQATVSVTVTPVNDPPIALDDSATTDEETEVVIAVLSNDSDPDGDPLVVVSIVPPEHGTAAIEDGVIVFVPDVDFSGTTSFTYTVTDPSGATATATVTVTVISDPDDDDDGIADEAEIALGTDKDDADTDDDGILDGDELTIGTDPLDPDSDGDGLLDGTEIGMGEPISEDTDPSVFVADLDPNSTTDPLDPDTDHGSVDDGVEDADHNGRVDPGERDPNVAEDDVITPPPLDLDGFLASGDGACSGGPLTAWSLLAALGLLAARRRFRRAGA